MSKRDFIDEILAKKRHGAYGALRSIWALERLEATLDGGTKDRASLALCVVGLVSAIEVAVRDVICKLIDSGEPYVATVGELLKGEARFGLDIVRAFQDKTVSLGDFVSHLLPVSSVTQINAHLDVLLDGKFHQVIGAVREYAPPKEAAWNVWQDADPVESQVSLLLIDDVRAVMSTIARAFAVRHAVAHEADFSSVSEAELREYLRASRSFVTAFYEFVRQTLEPNVPRTAAGQSLAAMIDAQASMKRMSDAFDRLVERLETCTPEFARGDSAALLKAAQNSFKFYLEAEVSFALALHNAGSGNAIRHIEAEVVRTIAEGRLDRLEDSLMTVNQGIELSGRGCGA